MITPCPNQYDRCPYYYRGSKLRGETTGCYADTDHIVRQALARRAGATALEKAYVYCQANLQQLCRWEHDLKDEPGFPPVREMIVALTVSFDTIQS